MRDLLNRLWRRGPTPFDVRQIELPVGARPATVAACLKARNIALVRGPFGAATQALFGPFAAHAGPGVNIPVGSSQRIRDDEVGIEFQTELPLVRAVLRDVAAIGRAYFQAVAGVSDIILPFVALNCRCCDPANDGPEQLVPFHQDAFSFPDIPVINCWVLLAPDSCGDAAPGLDFLPIALRDFQPMESTPASDYYAFLETDHGVIRDIAQRHPPITPAIARGDAMLFTGLAMHRTSTRKATRPRTSAEIRLAAATPAALTHVKALGSIHAELRRDDTFRWPYRWRLRKDGTSEALEWREAPL